MKYGMIFREVITESEKAASALQEFSPSIVIVPLDFGGRARIRQNDIPLRQKIIHEHLDLQVRNLLPHIQNATFSVIINSYYLPALKNQKIFIENIFPYVFQFVPDIATVYLDLGITPNYDGLETLCLSLLELADKMRKATDPKYRQIKFVQPNQLKIGLVAPIRCWMEDEDLKKMLGNGRIIPCPVAAIEPIRSQAEKITALYPFAHLFVSTAYKEEGSNFPKLDGPESIIFWSPFSLRSYSSIAEKKYPETRILEKTTMLKKTSDPDALDIKTVKAGTSIIVLKENGDYFQILTEFGIKGYIKKDI